MSEGPIIRPTDLLTSWSSWPVDMQNDTQLATAVVKVYLGEEWIFKHFDPYAKTPGHFPFVAIS